jgi:hypothetical protein
MALVWNDHQPRRPTRLRLPVRPGDAALWPRRPRPPSTVSHELLNSKHKSSSLAGIGGLLDQAWGQQRTTVDDAGDGASASEARRYPVGVNSGATTICAREVVLSLTSFTGW